MSKKIIFKFIIYNMKKSSYNSLTEKLIQNGILSDDKEILHENFFEALNTQTQKNVEDEALKLQYPESKKRLNQYDLELIGNKKVNVRQSINFRMSAVLKILGCIFGFNSVNDERIDNFFEKFFPNVYRAKKLREHISRLAQYSKSTNKTIPYGEQEESYESLVNYLNCANVIGCEIRKK